jgi:hypothetical protein
MSQSRISRLFRNLVSSRWFPPFLIAAIYIVCALLVNPRGEFPLNDDWAYTRSAFRLASGQGLRIDEWSAPSLVGQALYGGLLVRLVGQHFIVLRLSTLLLSCGIAILLFSTLIRLGTGRGIAWVAVLAWIFNPIQFWLSFTFMTEIPFLFFVAVGIWSFLQFSSTFSYQALVACAAAFGYAFLIRQTAILFIAVVFILLLAGGNGQTWRARIRRTAVFAAVAGSFVAAYQVWAIWSGGATPAVQRKFELLRFITPAQLNGNFFGILFYLSFMLLPLWICLLPGLYRLVRESRPARSVVVLCTWGAAAAYGQWWFGAHFARSPYLPAKAFHSRMPFLLNVLYDSGLGPVTLDPTYYGAPATPVHPGWWLAVTFLTAAGVVTLGSILTLGFPRASTHGARPAFGNLMLFSLLSVLAVIGFEVVFSHRQEGGLFDRHILTAALPALLLAAGLQRNGRIESPIRATKDPGRHIPPGLPAALAAATLFAWFSVSATHDYMAWNRLRWQLGNDLLRQGVDPLSISGGFEFNAWHNYDTFRARGNIRKVYYWWYDDLKYLVTMEPQERYSVLRRLDYYSWLHRRDMPVYLLRRTG